MTSTLALLLLNPALSAATMHPRPAPRTCEVSVSSAEPGAPPRVFSAAEVIDLTLTTAFGRRLDGIHWLELRLYTPQGFHYQTLGLPFDAGVRESHGRRPRRASASATLPVAGTSIMTEALYGRWRVVPFLDGSAEPCGPERLFEIGP